MCSRISAGIVSQFTAMLKMHELELVAAVRTFDFTDQKPTPLAGLKETVKREKVCMISIQPINISIQRSNSTRSVLTLV